MPLLLMVLMVSSPPPGGIWGEQGHRIACEIAFARLTPAARQLVQDIRARDSSPADSFAASCMWADQVRRTAYPETYAYHFINIPSGARRADWARDCGDPALRCVPWAIRHYATLLLDPARTAIERAEALKFLAHFVGDLHQPLHAGRAADLGGNRIRVDFFGQRTPAGDSLNLHWVWDISIVERAGLVWPDSAAALGAEITPAEAAGWESADVLAWVNESYRLSEELVYRLPPDKRIGAEYYADARAASRLQLKRAGVRLAYLLNRIADRSLGFPNSP